MASAYIAASSQSRWQPDNPTLFGSNLLEFVSSWIRRELIGMSFLEAACMLMCLTIGLYIIVDIRRTKISKSRAFSFMKLPPELRSEVLQYLLEPPHKESTDPPKYLIGWGNMIWLFDVAGNIVVHLRDSRTMTIAGDIANPTARLAQILRVDWSIIEANIERQKQIQKLRQNPAYMHLNSMTLVSKQFRDDFLATYPTRGHNIALSLDASSKTMNNPLRVPLDLLSRIKHCTLTILATPDIVKGFNPNEANVETWELSHAVFSSMRQMTELKSMKLIINAYGDHLWNPLHLWHFIAQAFKLSDVQAFNRIHFDMKGWHLLEPNHLERIGGGTGWEWRCKEGHLMKKGNADITAIRQFAAVLYRKCKKCESDHNAGSESESDEEDTGI